MLKQLAASYSVTFYWVPGHSDLCGNEVTDQLTRNGSFIPFVHPKTAIEISTVWPIDMKFLETWSGNFVTLEKSQGIL